MSTRPPSARSDQRGPRRQIHQQRLPEAGFAIALSELHAWQLPGKFRQGLLALDSNQRYFGLKHRRVVAGSRLVMLAPGRGHIGRHQQQNPLIPLPRFPEPFF